MRRPLTLAAVPAVAVLGLAVVPAAGSAATITPSAPCVSSLFANGSLTYQPMTGTITGGNPGANFVIAGKDGEASNFSGTFDAAGNAGYEIKSYVTKGIKPSAGRTVTLQVNEFVNGANALTGEVKIKKTNVAIDFDISSPRRLSAERRIKVSGTPFANQRVSAFVVKGGTSSTKVVRRVPLGTTNACGYLSKKAALFASSRPSTGRYTVYINAGRKLNKSLALGKGIEVVSRRRF